MTRRAFISYRDQIAVGEENGIFLFALSLFDAMPVLIEMGILLDVFVGVFIMAIVLNHITEEFERDASPDRRPKMGESF